jgi:outer membrane biosynthesis protein TonB
MPHPQNPGYQGQAPQGQRPPDGLSLPPAGLPKKGSAMLLIFVALGVMLLVGVGGIAVFLTSGRRDDKSVASSSKVPTVATSVASAEPSAPPPPPPPPPAATAEVASAQAEPVAERDPAPAPAPATAEVAPEPKPEPKAAPAPQPQFVPQPPPAVAVKDTSPAVDPNAFNESAARSRLGQANGVLVFCNKKGLTGAGTASVTFNPDGTVGAVTMDPPFAGTPAGDCVAGQFKRTKVSSFQGAPRTLKHSFDVPK